MTQKPGDKINQNFVRFKIREQKGNKVLSCLDCTMAIKCLLTSILVGSSQVKNMKVPFLRGRPWKMLRNVERADSSAGVGDLILGEMASSNASQKVLPSTSLTNTICSDFSRGAAHHKTYIRDLKSPFPSTAMKHRHLKLVVVFVFAHS